MRDLKSAPLGRRNAFTIDVEDYFQVAAFADVIRPSDWSNWPCRVEANTDLLLALLEEHNVCATFFTLGWVAERYPDLIKRIVAGGHELASHGYNHQKVDQQTPDVFRQDVNKAKALLEDLSGSSVLGYRAPSFSISSNTPWAFDILAEAGHQYSSSTYPIRHDHYGRPDDPKAPYYPVPGLLEIPVSTVDSPLGPLPAGGGGYFRLLPFAASHWLLKRYAQQAGHPAIFYMHPWEVDPDQPRVPGIPLKSRFRHYLNLQRVQGRLRRLMNEFEWGRMDHLFLNEMREECQQKTGEFQASVTS